LLKPFYPPGSVYYSPFSREEWMAFTAQLNLQHLFSRAGGEGVTTGTNYLGISIILGMNLIFHAI